MTEKPTYEELEKNIQELELYKQAEKTLQGRLIELELQNEELRRSQQEIIKSETSYAELYDLSPVGCFTISSKGLILKANLTLTGMLSMKRRYLIDQPISAYILFEDQDLFYLHLQNLSTLKTRQVCELHLKKKDGTPFYVALESNVILDECGKVDQYHVAVIDITERKRAEEELRKSEEKFRMLFDKAGDSIFIHDEQARMLAVNFLACDRLGYTHAELMSMKPNQVDIPEEALQMPDRIARLMEQGSITFETHHQCKDGSTIPVEVNSRLITWDAKPAVMSIARDITKRKQAKEVLQESERKYRNIYNNAQIGLYRARLHDGKMVMANNRMAEICGYQNVEECINNFVAAEHYVYPKRRDKLVESINEHGILNNFETPIRKDDGSIVWVQLSGIASSEKGFFEGIVVDITKRKKAEEEKLKAQKIAREQKKLALVGQIAGKMAHDFNNILQIIMGNAQLALVNSKDAETRKTLELIFEQTIQGKNLTKNLVAFAKKQEPKQEFFRISEKIDLVLNLMRKDLDGIELRKEESLGVPELLADPGMIEHALINLIQNSIHATSMNEFPRIIFRTYSLDNKICFEIEDNGCGISKKHLENIYEPSFTLKGSRDVTGSYKSGIKGTGYGMANVKKYVEQHKGSISIESEFGSGTKFTISLPIIKKELTTKEKAELKKEITQFEKNILLVEDETAISDVQYRILTSELCNHKVDVANNGQMAKDLFERNTYDFVSLDYVLPGGINGMDVYHHIRKTNQTVPVLFISGNIEFLESIKKLKQKDAYIDHLSKPCQNKDYVNGINELLEKTLSEQ